MRDVMEALETGTFGYKMSRHLVNFKTYVFLNGFGFIISLIVLSVLIYIPLLFVSMTEAIYDEGTFLFIANKALSGAVPYKSYFDHKPPGIYFIYSSIIAVSGTSIAAIRFTVFLFNLGTAVLVYFLGRNIWDERVGRVGAMLFIICAFTPGALGFVGQTEPFLLFFILAGLLLIIKAEDSSSKKILFTAGIAFGCATLFKQSAFLIFAAILVFFILSLRYRSNRNVRIQNEQALGEF
jgi:4-amino-4-deoxy-L-arabinose transferase-like glycosyltransferase